MMARFPRRIFISLPKILLLAMSCWLFLVGCETVRPYQKVYLNDEEMALRQKAIEQYEFNFESYREGASGANGGKTGGGCGCN